MSVEFDLTAAECLANAQQIAQSGDGDATIAFCRRAIAIYPMNTELRQFLHQVLKQTQQYRLLAETTADWLRSSPDDPVAYRIFADLNAKDLDQETAQRIREYATKLEAATNSTQSADSVLGHLPEIWSEEHKPETEQCQTGEGTLPILAGFNIWGEAYLNTFLDYCLPSLLSPNNFPLIAKTYAGSYIWISIPLPDYVRLKRQLIFEELVRLVRVKITIIKQPYPSLYKYDAITALMNIKRRAAIEARNVLATLDCDAVFADGALFRAAEVLFEKRKLCLLTGGFRADVELFNRRLQNEVRSFRELLCARHELVHIALTCMHHEHTGLNVDTCAATPMPFAVFWTVPGHGLLAHQFGLWPILVHPDLMARGGEIVDMFDSGYLPSLVQDTEEIYIFDNSDDYFAFSLSNRNEGELYPEVGWFDRQNVYDWLRKTPAFFTDLNKFYARQAIRIHTRDIVRPVWTNAEATAIEMIEWLIGE